MKEEGLKFCPFCGEVKEVAIGIKMIHGDVVAAQGSCICGALGPQEETEEEAIDSWNTRAEESHK